jgi:hypothetical protein
VREVKKIPVLLALGLLFVPSVLSAAYKTASVPDGAVVSGKVVFKGKAWHPFLGTKEKKVSISAKGEVETNFEFSR